MFKRASLTPYITDIVVNKGTERPCELAQQILATRGTYLCRACGLALFKAQDRFPSTCGWPSFDDSLTQAVKQRLDADGHRTEILCARCDAHLGHVFSGEQLTAKNLRHCVNDAALDFIKAEHIKDTAEAILAAGCFWGAEQALHQTKGVLLTEVGYTGGHLANPSYEQVCRSDSGHVEAVRVIFDPIQLTYEDLIKHFFEIHDPSQRDGQGPDRGSQYLSKIFVYNEQQRDVATNIIKQLKTSGFPIVTSIEDVNVFWPAEDYHQSYFEKKLKSS